MSTRQPSLPRINTDYPERSIQFSLDTTYPFTPTGVRAPDLPSFRLSTSTDDAITQDVPTRPPKSLSINRARDEGRKLLAHILSQLCNRPMPPSVLDTIGTLHEETTREQSFTDAVKSQMGRLGRGQHRGEGSDDEEQSYSIDSTFRLMIQLQDILVLSLDQRWDIFDDTGSTQKSVLSSSSSYKPSSSPFRRSRNSFSHSGRRSRSPSPNQKTQIFVSELLALCISVLASVIAEDCRFQTVLPRPSCPPNALQAVSLNVAQVLLHINAHDYSTISQIGLALIPAFSAFNEAMYPRLISFFNHGIIRNALWHLKKLQGFDTNHIIVNDSVSHPLVSIHVDEVAEDKLQNHQTKAWSPWALAGKVLKIQSTNAPAQPMPVYYLSSVIPPLLGCALDSIELDASDEKGLAIIQALQTLLKTIVDLKADANLDLLQVVAYHTPRARKSAIALLSIFWPRTIGHIFISQPPTIHLARTLSLKNCLLEHHFIPWQFRHRHSWYIKSSQYVCNVCRKGIYGFGLFCPDCTCAVHLECYDNPEGSALVQYAHIADTHIQRVAMFRYSKFWNDLYPGSTKGSHRFRQISLFTLSLCSICQQPLWGCSSQGLRCDACSQFVHTHCLGDAAEKPCVSAVIDSADLTIQFSLLRRSCLEAYRDVLDLTQQNLSRKSYEEISIFQDVLSTQLKILNYGLSLGTLLIAHKDEDMNYEHQKVPDFELHHTINWCEELLSIGGLFVSPAIEEHLQENGLLQKDHSMLYTWSSLVHVAAAMKSPSAILGTSVSTSSEFLNVAHIDMLPDAETEASHPFDTVSLSHMRDVLGHEFHIHSNTAAYMLLSHLQQLTFFIAKNGETFTDLATMWRDRAQPCSFPLPLGLDLSIDVETLVSAIEACLSDTDLYVNESGFLLLVRRMWPDGLMSDYGLERLARAVFTWIINEDSQLAVVFRDYLGKGKPLPGMASTSVNQWPPIHYERPVHAGSMQNGGDYLTSRHALLDQYARRWLLALHNLTSDLYSRSLFETCDDLAHQRVKVDSRNLSYNKSTPEHSQQCEQVLHHILRLSQVHVLFSVTDTIYLRWLEFAHSYETLGEGASSTAILKLFSQDPDYRTSTTSTTGAVLNGSPAPETCLWSAIMKNIHASQLGLGKGLRWLGLLSRSGVDIPLNVYSQFIVGLESSGNPLEGICLFSKTVLASLWLRSLGRQRYQPLFANYHLSSVPAIHDALRHEITRPKACNVIQSTLASCLLLYGCDRTYLLSTGLVENDFIASLPSRRKLARETVDVDPIFIDPAIMKAITLHIKVESEDVILMIAKFLHAFFTSSALIETHEMDNFVFKNEHLLSKCAWKFYDTQRPEIAKLRTVILLRILSVDPEAFISLLEKRLSPSRRWEKRARSVTRLFRIIQDVCHPSFNVDGRQWKSSAVKVFQIFFSLLWSDSEEEVRLLAKTHCSSLLPAHFEAITSCFDEMATRAPIFDRLRLTLFLTQLRTHIPKWQVLSWDSILKVLNDNDDYGQTIYPNTDPNGDNEPFSVSGSDSTRLDVSLIVLALDMLSDGVKINCLSLIKLKAQLMKTLGFQDVSVALPYANGHGIQVAYGEIRSMPEVALPCLGGLLSLLDSWHKTELPASVITNSHDSDEEVEVLIGTAYADIPLNMLAAYEKIIELPALSIKHILEAIHVIIYKHDFENRDINVFSSQSFKRATTRALDLLEVDAPYEVRQMALSVVQAFFNKSTTFTGSLLLNVIEIILKIVNPQVNQSGQDPLTEQGFAFVGDILEKYSRSGLFISLLRRPLEKKIFLALKRALEFHRGSSSLSDDLLQDTLPRLFETDSGLLQDLLYNVQHFVDIVHHERYSSELINQSVTLKQLINFAQRLSDGSGATINASPLFVITAIVLQHNKSNSNDLVTYLDALLRITLIRLQVDTKSISRLLTVIDGKKHSQDSLSTTMATVYDILNEGLRLKARVPANTLKSVLEALVTVELSPGITPVTLHSQLYVGLVDCAGYWLDNYYWMDGQIEEDFHASLAVAKMIFSATMYDAFALQKLSMITEKDHRPQLRSIRAWNLLAIAALSEKTDSSWTTQLFRELKTFTVVYLGAFWPYTGATNRGVNFSTADINQAYLAIKLWLMVAKRSAEPRLGSIYHSVWNELWPPFESIIGILETEEQSSTSHIMAEFIASSVVDLFNFLGCLRIPLRLEKAAQKSTLKRLQSVVRGESVLMKINRALDWLSETPPETPLEVLVDQTAKDIVATEKLRLLEGKREPVKVTMDRRTNVEKKTTADRLNWRDVRMHT